MTTKNSFYAFAALAAMTLASCNNDEEVASGNYPADNVVRVTAGVDDLTSRATYTTGNITEFGFCIHNAASTDYSYDNIQVEKKDGNWTPAEQMLWQNATQAVTVIAYAPYLDDSYAPAEIWNNTEFPVSVGTDQSGATDHSDFLAYKKSDFVPENDLVNKAVNIEFKHMLSQVNLTITLGTEFNKTENLTATNPITDIKIGGTVLSGSCDFTKDTPAVAVKSDATAGEITPTNGTYAKPADETKTGVVKYSAILFPQTVEVGNFTVSFAINGKFYKWSATSAVTLESGKSYKLELTVGKDVVLTGNITTTAWVDGNTGSSLETE